MDKRGGVCQPIPNENSSIHPQDSRSQAGFVLDGKNPALNMFCFSDEVDN